VWPTQPRHAAMLELAHADDAQVAISSADPGAISAGEP
jgi:hypothetical protein